MEKASLFYFIFLVWIYILINWLLGLETPNKRVEYKLIKKRYLTCSSSV